MSIWWCIIKIRERRLYAYYCDTVMMWDQFRNSVLLLHTLYVSKLKVNLLSEKWMCENELQRSFDQHRLYMCDRHDKIIIETWEQEDIYIVKHITKDLNEFALSAMCQQCESEIALSSQINKLMSSDLWVWNALTDHNCNQRFSMSDTSNHNSAEENNCDHADLRDQKIKMYKLWHWHFAHLGSAKLHNLHKVTTLSKSIFIVKDEGHVCEVCALTKFVNQWGHEVSERKAAILALISINICRPLPLSYKGYQYFLEIIDNHLWKIWSILLKRWSNTPQTLQEWWLKTELQSGAKMQAVHSDNVTELKTTLDEWCMFFEITLQYTVSYMSIQNGVVKWAIKMTENSVHVMIKEIKLSIEFWVQAAEINVYLCNCTAIESIIDDQSTTSEKAFTELKSFINHIHMWGCKCYVYVNLRSLSTEDRQNKFMNCERVKVFMRYINEITKQYWLWVSDLKHIIRSYAVKFAENEKKENVNLKLSRQTSNTLSEWKSVEWSCKKNTSILSSASAETSTSVNTELTDSDSWV